MLYHVYYYHCYRIAMITCITLWLLDVNAFRLNPPVAGYVSRWELFNCTHHFQ